MAAAIAHRVLGATAVESSESGLAVLLSGLSALCDSYPALDVIVNFFDEAPDDKLRARRMPHARIVSSFVPGMKSLFWKLGLTPAVVRPYSAVWIFDSDIIVHPSVLPLGGIADAFLSSGASIAQPVVRAYGGGTAHMWLRQRAVHMSCLAATAKFVEMQSAFFRAEAWSVYSSEVMARIPDRALAVSDFGMDVMWCAALADLLPARPPCLVLYAWAYVHLNGQTLARYMNKTTLTEERSCSLTCTTLKTRFRRYWMNYSHDTGECWGATPRGLERFRPARYVAWNEKKHQLESVSLYARNAARAAAHEAKQNRTNAKNIAKAAAKAATKTAARVPSIVKGRGLEEAGWFRRLEEGLRANTTERR